MKNNSPQLYRYKTTLMQRIQTSVLDGYVFFISGTVYYNKIEKLIKKFEELYETNLSKDQIYRRRKNGKSVSKLFIYPEINSKYFYWWIVATEGENNFFELEKVQDARDKRTRIRFGKDYELLPISFEGKKTTWTWRMTKTRYELWHNQIRTIIRRSNSEQELRKMIFSLLRAPGFSGVRNQVSKLIYQIKNEWKRIKNNIIELPSIPKNIGYIRRLPDEFVDLETVLIRISKGKKPFPIKKKKAPVASTQLTE